MTNDRILAMARDKVPKRLWDTAKIVSRVRGAVPAMLAGPGSRGEDRAMAEELAKELGVELGPDDPDAADVAFTEATPVGRRVTVVQIRRGKVAGVLRQA